MRSNIFRVIASGSSARLVTLPVGAVATAVTAHTVISYAGAALYGYIGLVASLAFLIPFSDLGLAAPIINAISRRRTSGDLATAGDDEVLAVVFHATMILGCLGLLITLGSLFLSIFHVWTMILGVPDSDSEAIDAAVTLAIGAYFLPLPLGIGARLLVGAGRVGLLGMMSPIVPVVTMFVTWGLVAADVQPIFLSAAPCIGISVGALISSMVGLRVVGIGFKALIGARNLPRPNVRGEALPYLAVSVAVPLGMQGGRLVLGQGATASALASYTLAFQLFTPALSVVTSGAAGIWAEMNSRREERRHLWIRSLLILGCFGSAMAVSYGLLARPAGRIVSDGTIMLSWPLIAAFAFAIVVLGIHQASGLLLTDERGLRFQAFCSGWFALAATAIPILMVSRMGAAAAPFGILVGGLCALMIPGILRARAELC